MDCDALSGSQPIARGRKERASREEGNVKLTRPSASDAPRLSPTMGVIEAAGEALYETPSTVSIMDEDVAAAAAAAGPVHNDVVRPPRERRLSQEMVKSLSGGRRTTRPSREEMNVKLARPPRADGDAL